MTDGTNQADGGGARRYKNAIHCAWQVRHTEASQRTAASPPLWDDARALWCGWLTGVLCGEVGVCVCRLRRRRGWWRSARAGCPTTSASARTTSSPSPSPSSYASNSEPTPTNAHHQHRTTHIPPSSSPPCCAQLMSTHCIRAPLSRSHTQAPPAWTVDCVYAAANSCFTVCEVALTLPSPLRCRPSRRRPRHCPAAPSSSSCPSSWPSPHSSGRSSSSSSPSPPSPPPLRSRFPRPRTAPRPPS